MEDLAIMVALWQDRSRPPMTAAITIFRNIDDVTIMRLFRSVV